MSRITTTHQMVGTGLGPTVEEVKRFILGFSDEAQILLKLEPNAGQRNEGSWTLTINDAPKPTPLSMHPSWMGTTHPPGVR